MKRNALWGLSLLGLSLFGGEEPNRTLVFQFEHEVRRANPGDYMQIRLAFPVSEAERQNIKAIRVEPDPDGQSDENLKRIAEWKWRNFERQRTILVEIAVELVPPRKKPVPGRPPPRLPPQEAVAWLKSEPLVQSDDPLIRNMAKSIPEAEDMDALIQAITDRVVEHLEYEGFQAEDKGAVTAVRERKGDCTEYADLFTALCRAKGMPARSRLTWLSRSVDTPLHSVSEVFVPGRGWVLVDPLWGELTGRPQSELPNRYVLLALDRSGEGMFEQFTDRATQKFGTAKSEEIRSRLRVLERKEDGSVNTTDVIY